MSAFSTIKRFVWPREEADAKARERAEQARGRPTAHRDPIVDARPERGPSATLRTVGRVFLWLVLAIVGIRGVGAIVDGDTDTRAADTGRPVAAGWPDEAASAFAVRFTTAYLTYSPRQPELWTQTVEPFLGGRVDADEALELPDRGRDQTAEQAVVAGVRRIDAGRAVVTVATRVVGRRVGTRYLAVPVGRDSAGGLAVYDYPAFVAGPGRPSTQIAPPADAPVEDDRADIEALVSRFLPAYLGGRDLGYLLGDGATVRPLAAPLRFRELLGLAEVEGTPAGRRQRTVIATVRARDVATSVDVTLRYRLDLTRLDRWVVQRVVG